MPSMMCRETGCAVVDDVCTRCGERYRYPPRGRAITLAARAASRVARWMDTEAFFLLSHGGWRGRLGSRMDVWAADLGIWAFRQGVE